jgi:predicted kinase
MGKGLTLYMPVGLPASGKSTWAREMCTNNSNIVRVNRDDIRNMLTPAFKFGGPMESLVTSIEDKAIHKALQEGYSVIVDATNFRGASRFKKILEETGAVLVEVDFTNVSKEECIERDSKRTTGKVGKEVIERMFNQYINKNTSKQ